MLKKLSALVVICFLSSFAHGEPANVTSLANPETSARQKNFFEHFNFYLNMVPPPLLSGGAGGAIEFQPVDWLSFWAGHQREATVSDLNIGDEHVQVQSTEEVVGVRGFYFFRKYWGLFLDGGFKWSRVDTTGGPGIAKGVEASQSDYVRGTFAGFGGRFRWDFGKHFTLLADAEVAYEPGKVTHAKYVGDEPGIFGPSKAHIETELGYGFFPRARVGCSF